jgi:hypothetical protein
MAKQPNPVLEETQHQSVSGAAAVWDRIRQSHFQLVDKDFQPITGVKIPTLEERGVTYQTSYKIRGQTYWVHRDDSSKLKKIDIDLGSSPLKGVNGIIKSDDNLYTQDGYPLIKETALNRFGGKYYFVDSKSSKVNFAKASSSEDGTLTLDGKIYEKDGDTYVDFEDSAKIYNTKGDRIIPITNQGLANKSASHSAIDTKSFKDAFYIQTKARPANIADPDQIQATVKIANLNGEAKEFPINLHRLMDKRGRTFYRSEALLATHAIDMRNASILAGFDVLPGAKFTLTCETMPSSYMATTKSGSQIFMEEEMTVSLGSVPIEGMVGFQPVIITDRLEGDSKDKVDQLKGSVRAFEREIAPFNIGVIVHPPIILSPAEVQGLNAGQIAELVTQRSHYPKAVNVVVGASLVETSFFSREAQSSVTQPGQRDKGNTIFLRETDSALRLTTEFAKVLLYADHLDLLRARNEESIYFNNEVIDILKQSSMWKPASQAPAQQSALTP